MNFAEFFAECPLAAIPSWPSSCFSMLISKALSTAILLGSVALKLPQILNIVSTENVVGLSPQSFYTEVPLYITSVIYNYRQNYPFLSYGESVMILFQNIILVFLLWRYIKPAPTSSHMISILGLFVAVFVGCLYLLPDMYLYILPLSNLPLMIYARTIQIYNSYKVKRTGSLSSITTGLNLLGSLARVFTTIQEVGWDMSLLSGFLISSALSGIQLFQVSLDPYYTLSRIKLMLLYLTRLCLDCALRIHDCR